MLTLLTLLALVSLSLAEFDLDRHNRFIACSDLARIRVDTSVIAVEEIVKKSPVSPEATLDKVIVELLQKCEKLISQSETYGDVTKLEKDELQKRLKYVELDVEKYRMHDSNFSLTEEEEVLVDGYITNNGEISEATEASTPINYFDFATYGSGVKIAYACGVGALVLGVIYLGQKMMQKRPRRSE
jgi:hypothetical protein